VKYTENQIPMVAQPEVQPDLSLAFVGQSLNGGFDIKLSWSTFHNISCGEAKPEDIEQLNAFTAVRNINLLRRLLKDVSVAGFDETAGLGFVHTIGDTLTQAEQNDADSFRTAWTYPFFNGFTKRVFELLNNKEPGYRMSEQVATRIAHETGATVAAVAIRCDAPCNVDAYVHQDQLVLPSLGSLQLPTRMTHINLSRTSDGKVLIRDKAGEFEMELPSDLSQSTADWQPVRMLHAEAEGQTVRVALDDLHYNRSVFAENFTGRLSEQTVARWQQQFRGAWEILLRHVPETALAAAGVLRAIIPYKTPAYGMFTVSNSTHYRAIGSSIPDKPVNFAKEILHETSHNILDRLHDLVQFTDLMRFDQTCWSPWRRDPRPIGGHIHGMYAHSVLASFSRVMAGHATTEEDRQHFTIDFARWRKKVKAAASILMRVVNVEGLDPASNNFVGCLLPKILELQSDVVDERIENFASDEVTDHYTAWRLANLQVAPAEICKLVDIFMSWEASDPAHSSLNIAQKPDLTAQPIHVPPKNRDSFFAKHRLFDMYQNDPDMFRAISEDPKLLAAFKGVVPADVALVNGDHKEALRGYESLIRQHPEVPHYWPAFLTTLLYFVPHKENRALGVLLGRPDILQPVYAGVTKKMAEQQLGRIRPRDFVEQLAAMLSTTDINFETSEASDE